MVLVNQSLIGEIGTKDIITNSSTNTNYTHLYEESNRSYIIRVYGNYTTINFTNYSSTYGNLITKVWKVSEKVTSINSFISWTTRNAVDFADDFKWPSKLQNLSSFCRIGRISQHRIKCFS